MSGVMYLALLEGSYVAHIYIHPSDTRYGIPLARRLSACTAPVYGIFSGYKPKIPHCPDLYTFLLHFSAAALSLRLSHVHSKFNDTG